jgi:hypothetical protein
LTAFHKEVHPLIYFVNTGFVNHLHRLAGSLCLSFIHNQLYCSWSLEGDGGATLIGQLRITPVLQLTVIPYFLLLPRVFSLSGAMKFVALLVLLSLLAST